MIEIYPILACTHSEYLSTRIRRSDPRHEDFDKRKVCRDLPNDVKSIQLADDILLYASASSPQDAIHLLRPAEFLSSSNLHPNWREPASVCLNGLSYKQDEIILLSPEVRYNIFTAIITVHSEHNEVKFVAEVLQASFNADNGTFELPLLAKLAALHLWHLSNGVATAPRTLWLKADALDGI